MKDELINKLCKDFSEIYLENEEKEYIPFDFEGVPDSWFDLIYKLSLDIKNYCIYNEINIPKVCQVKEKFGTLRFYLAPYECEDTKHFYYIENLINEAEKKSGFICYKCGKEITLKNRRATSKWIIYFCEDCYTEEKNER